ncbi:MAG: D-alanyl-D-alanine carboxypeptidase [Clostridia bacterium]|nr:D-alanyl-D-alanine carboxypeptidase [Clostridia bacterium]
MRKRVSVVCSLVLCMAFLCMTVMPVYAVKNKIDFKTKTEIFYLVNLDTDTVVYSQNSDKKCYPASTTKIMTYIIVTEQIQDLENTKVTIKPEVLEQLLGTDSSLSGVENYAKKELSVYQLLNCMMVSSGNDAALVLADFIGQGDVDSFVALMNEKATKLGCKKTHFVNPHGLHDEEQYTTAEDMFKIAKFAMTTPYFTDITNTVEYYIEGDSDEPLRTTNKMIDPDEKDYYYKYAKGIKTGTTDEAGHCLVSTALKDNVSYMCVAMHAPCYDEDGIPYDTNYAILESKKMYEWAYKNITMREVLGKDRVVSSIDVNYGQGTEKVNLVPEYAYSTMLDKNVKDSEVVVVAKCQKKIDAPVTKGTVLGTATVSYNGEELTKVNLVAEKNIEKSQSSYFAAIAKNIFQSLIFRIIVMTVVALFVLYVILILLYSGKKKKKR